MISWGAALYPLSWAAQSWPVCHEIPSVYPADCTKSTYLTGSLLYRSLLLVDSLSFGFFSSGVDNPLACLVACGHITMAPSLSLCPSRLSVQSEIRGVHGSNEETEREAGAERYLRRRDIYPQGLISLGVCVCVCAGETETESVTCHLIRPFLWFHRSWIIKTLWSAIRVVNGSLSALSSLPLKWLCGLLIQ